MSPLIPRSPHDTRTVYALLLDHLAEQVVADRDALAVVALECTAHLAGLTSLRIGPPRCVVLHGSDTTGLTAIAREAAAGMGLPHVTINLSVMSEVGWYGRSLAECLSPLAEQELLWGSRAVIVLAGLDSLRIRHGSYRAGSGTTEDYRIGKSGNVASMLRGEPVSGYNLQEFDASHTLIFVTSSQLPSHDEDGLWDHGIVRELGAVLAMATWIHVPQARASSPSA